MLNAKFKVDMVRQPPQQDSLIPHVQRVDNRLISYRYIAEHTFVLPKLNDDDQDWLKTEEIGSWSPCSQLANHSLTIWTLGDSKNDEDQLECEDAESYSEEAMELDDNDLLADADF